MAAPLLLHRWRSRVGLLLLISSLIGILRRRPVCAGRGIVVLTHVEGRGGSDALCSLLAEIDRKLTRGCGGAGMPENYELNTQLATTSALSLKPVRLRGVLSHDARG